jgi:hypothetical protein
MGNFLEKWASTPSAGPRIAAQTKQPEPRAETNTRLDTEQEFAAAAAESEDGVLWAEWKAASLNRLFQVRGVTAQPGHITAATVRHGEFGRRRVDCAATNEQPMSGAEAAN